MAAILGFVGIACATEPPSVALEVVGRGPVVVLESGLGQERKNWDRVARALTPCLTVVTYDRPGIEESPPLQDPEAPVLASTVAADLLARLRARGLPEPYILVGHSLGGLYVQAFARNHPSAVAGLVLVDASSPLEPPGVFVSTTPPKPGSVEAAEELGVGPSVAALLSGPPLPALPLVVMSVTDHGDTPEREAEWRDVQQRTAALSPKGRLAVVDGGHFLQADRPEQLLPRSCPLRRRRAQMSRLARPELLRDAMSRRSADPSVGRPSPAEPIQHPGVRTVKTRRVQAAIVLLGLLILPAHANDQLSSPSMVSWIDAQMGASGIPGASVAVVKDYEIKWAAGFGTSNKANGRKVTSATLFQACSISKPVTAIAAMIALDQKRLEVDRDVNAILDEFSSQSDFGRWKLQSRYSTPVTLRMLLSHTGGTNDFRYSGYRYGYYRHPPAPINEIPTMREELDGLPPAKTPAITVSREPGATWIYSPAGYTVIQAILTSLYGKPFPDIMDALVLTPLGLQDSTFSQPTPPDLTPRMAVPYVPDGTPLPDGPRVFNTSASGGLTTTPTDLAKLMIAFQKALAGRAEQGLTPEIARSMMVRQPGETRAGECFGSSDPAKVACRSSWGLGFDVNLTKDFEHRPDGDPTGPYFGHSGFNSGYLALMLGSKTGGHGVVVMVNVAPEDMSGPAPQFTFLTGLVRQVAAEEQWP